MVCPRAPCSPPSKSSTCTPNAAWTPFLESVNHSSRRSRPLHSEQSTARRRTHATPCLPSADSQPTWTGESSIPKDGCCLVYTAQEGQPPALRSMATAAGYLSEMARSLAVEPAEPPELVEAIYLTNLRRDPWLSISRWPIRARTNLRQRVDRKQAIRRTNVRWSHHHSRARFAPYRNVTLLKRGRARAMPGPQTRRRGRWATSTPLIQ